MLRLPKKLRTLGDEAKFLRRKPTRDGFISWHPNEREFHVAGAFPNSATLSTTYWWAILTFAAHVKRIDVTDSDLRDFAAAVTDGLAALMKAQE